MTPIEMGEGYHVPARLSYYCSICGRSHNVGSKIGREHYAAMEEERDRQVPFDHSESVSLEDRYWEAILGAWDKQNLRRG